MSDAELIQLFPERAPTLHKGTAGRLLVVAGSLDYPGAALLATTAAARSGVGLVTLAVPRSLQPLFAARVTETVLLGLPEGADGGLDLPAVGDLLERGTYDAILLGPGLAPSAETYALLRRLAETPGGPLLLDAGALGACAHHGGVPQSDRPLLLTPHVGEFLALAPEYQEPSLDAVVASAARWGALLVRKSATTLLADPSGRQNELGSPNPALATAGSGDVLAGIIAGLLAQGLAPYDAARLGVFWHAATGADLRARLGDAGVIASDLLAQLPLTRRRLLEEPR